MGVVAVILILSSFGYAGYSFWLIQKQYLNSETKVLNLENGLSVSQKNLSELKSEYLTTLELLKNEKQTNAYFEEKINTISSTVGILEKLSKIDSELLKKYSKVYFLNENYIPPRLTDIPTNYLYVKDKPLQFHADAYPFLQKLLDASITEGVPILVISAYR